MKIHNNWTMVNTTDTHLSKLETLAINAKNLKAKRKT